MKYTLIVAALLATAAGEATPATTPACEITSMELYKAAGCTEKAETQLTAKELTAMKPMQCVTVASASTKWTCTAKALKSELFATSATCEGTATTTVEYEWGKCVSLGGKWVKISGAKTLMASATIALAFVGSQF